MNKIYRIGRKQKRALLGNKGAEVALFRVGSEDLAQHVRDMLNAENNPKYDCDDCEYYPCFHHKMIGLQSKIKRGTCGDYKAKKKNK